MKKSQKTLFEQTSKRHQNISNSKIKQSNDQQLDDVMAWGHRRQNYYRQDEEEYSSLSEEEKEAQQIYNNKYQNYLNDFQVYDLPQDQSDQNQRINQNQISFDQNLDHQQDLPDQFINSEILWVLHLFKNLRNYQSDRLLIIYERLLKSYLTVVLAIKQLKIPYIQYHPIVPMAVDIKSKIVKLVKSLVKKPQSRSKEQNNQRSSNTFKFKSQTQGTLHSQKTQQISIHQQKPVQRSAQKQSSQYISIRNQSRSFTNQNEDHQKGLSIYKSMQVAQREEKKNRKYQKRQARNLKTAMFKQLTENEGRFASELILKNKGLVKKRKKIDGNSRVKLRKKYEKKKSIHKAKSGHLVRENPGRAYEGQTNIRTGKIGAVKLK